MVQVPDLGALPFSGWLERRIVDRRSADGADDPRGEGVIAARRGDDPFRTESQPCTLRTWRYARLTRFPPPT